MKMYWTRVGELWEFGDRLHTEKAKQTDEVTKQIVLLLQLLELFRSDLALEFYWTIDMILVIYGTLTASIRLSLFVVIRSCAKNCLV